TPQSGDSIYAPPITREHCRIDLSRSAAELDCQVRALNPKPGALLSTKDETFKIFRLSPNADGLFTLPCGSGECVAIEELQVPGGKRMKIADYLRGHPLPKL
ncbi:MAG: methionyl-tRNA formyltransferase, partial [Oscillospiraceae bacterium]|nr:methionyl-tRNA formyltransferase [Oscillospiraceae bacterium]